MKKIFSIFICVMMIFSMFASFGASAVQKDDTVTKESYLTGGDDAQPLVNAPCTGGNGICQMKSRGWGSVYNIDTNKWVLNMACCWQCKNCKTVIITQGDPLLGEVIGTYAMCGSNVSVGIVLTVVRVNSSMIGYLNSTKMEGYRFMNG